MLSVVILNWNAAEDTIRCAREVAGWEEVRPSIWVVDNASADDSADRIAQACPSAHLIRSRENLGFAGGTNLGIQAALAASDAPVLLLNNDAEISGADVARLVQTLAENPQIGFVVPLLYDESGALIAAGGKNPVKHMQTRVRELPEGAVGKVEVVSGTAVLIRPDVFHQVGLLDERFFFSTEIADLCLRANKVGAGCVVDRRAKASHAVSRSSHWRSTLYVYYIVRNRFLILRNHYRYNVPLFLFWAAYSLALAGKLWLDGQRPSARAVWLALWDGVRGRFGDQNQRVMGTTDETV
ncbi:MAG: glycosyltransferase family 2 protein [Chloroflexi bacterium]|nr:glycosyltransferase family 2 protein [Chloroflexota bacterium]